MKICLVDINRVDRHLMYKDFNGSLGTRFEVGNSFLAKFIENLKLKSIDLPILSFGYAAAIFFKYGHEVSYVNRMIDVPKDTDLAVFHTAIANCKNEKQELKILKENISGKICLVGAFSSFVPSFFNGLCDFIIKGEPESLFEEIAKNNNLDYSGVVVSEPYQNLDELVFPNWKIFPYESYSYSPNIIGRPILPVLSSRGCIYNCDYCAYKFFYRYRQRSVENVLKEIDYLKKNYKVKGIIFRDPIFTASKERTMNLLRGMINNNLKIQFACETRLDHLDFELVDKLSEAGCISINVGIESFDDEILKQSVRKPIEKKHQEEIVARCNKKGISISAFYILGLPGDTEKNISRTIKYAKGLNTLNASFNVFTPYPGTDAFDKHKNDIVEHDFSKYSTYYPIIRYDSLTPGRILKLKEFAFVSYYFRIRYSFRFFSTMIKKYSKYVSVYRHF